MTEEEIVKKVCEIMDVKYSHYDNHDMPMDYFPHMDISAKPKIVAYSSRMGMWEFAILENMNILTSTSESGKFILQMTDVIKKLDDKKDKKYSSYYKEMKAELGKIEKAEKWLKENNCEKIINNSKKKIHLEW